jgi:chorismate mutase
VKLEHRKAGKFRTRQEKNLLVDLEDAGDVTSHRSDAHVGDFRDVETEYITKWIRQFNDFKYMSWVSLREIRIWEAVQKSLEVMIKNKIILNSESTDKNILFDEHCYVQKYVEGKCEIWKEKKLPEGER